MFFGRHMLYISNSVNYLRNFSEMTNIIEYHLMCDNCKRIKDISYGFTYRIFTYGELCTTISHIYI